MEDAILNGIRQAATGDADFFLMSFETAEQKAISMLSGGKLRAFGRKNGNGLREPVPAEEWPGLAFYHDGIEAPLWPERSSPHIGRRGDLTSIRDPNEAANPPFWTDVIFEREAVLAIWPDPLEQAPISGQDHPPANPRDAEALGQAQQSSKKRRPPRPAAVTKFLLGYADGTRSERACKSAAEEHFGVSLPEKSTWRPAWSQVPKERKFARGQWSRREQA